MQAAAAAEEFRRARQLKGDRHQRAVRLALVHGSQARALLRGQQERGIGHAERCADVVTEVVGEGLAARRLDRLADPVGIDAVFPALAWLEDQRCVEGGAQAAAGTRQPRGRHVAAHDRVPVVVAEARGVGQQVAQGDRPRGRPQAGLVTIEAFEELWCCERRQERADRCIERQRTPLDQLHGRYRGERLGHRGDPEHGILVHRGAAREIAQAEGALVDDAVRIGCHRDHAWHGAAVDPMAQRSLDLAGLDHRSFSRDCRDHDYAGAWWLGTAQNAASAMTRRRELTAAGW